MVAIIGVQAAQMWKFLPELLATPVPRYTSYPTAAEFHEGIGEAEQCAGLQGVGDEEEISLYLHIPYCREICWYCGCNTGAANKSQRLANYLDQLNQEIDLVAAKLNGRGRAVRVAFGGGSPNAIAPRQFLGLVNHLRSAFALPNSLEMSIEIDPRGFDEAFAEALACAGVTKASLGVQTLSPEIQAAIGRVQPRESIERSVSLLRNAGIGSLNFDLMYGLPRQDEAALLESIKQSHDFGADRLAVFGYAHVPHMVPRQRRIDAESLPDAPLRFRQANVAYDWLLSRGWTAVGFDHFAREHDPLSLAARDGRVRRNFQGFTDDRCDTLIGLGASAISRFPAALVQNERNSGRYSMNMGLGRLAGTKGVATPPSERLRGRRIEELLCRGSTDISKMPERLTVRQRLRNFENSRLIRWTDWRLELLEGSIPYARSVAAALDPWRKQSTKQFSTAV